MPPNRANETAAARIPAILVAAMVTASAHVETAYDKPPIVANDPPGITTAFDGLPSGLSGYPETTATTQPARGVAISGFAPRPVSPTDLLSRRIRSIPYERRDCPQSTAQTAAAVDDALRFAGLLPAGSPVPHLSVADDGEINFFRRQEGLFIDVGFFGDNQIHYYVQVEALGIDVADSCPFDGESLPRDLIVALTTE